MSNISAALPVYTPPVVSAPSPVTATPDVTTNTSDASTPAPVSANAPATNANDSSPGVYTALANVSASTIRGTNVNTAT